MIRFREDATASPAPSYARGDNSAQLFALQRKLDAIRDYVVLCAADELEPTTILEILDADLRKR